MRIRQVAFNKSHPLIPFLYYLGMAVITMLTLHPVVLAASMLGAFCSAICLIGWRNATKFILLSLPIIVLVIVFNALFVHRGETVLFFLNNSAVTLEAVIYGCCAGVMFISAFLWMRCFSIVLTAEKIIFLIGRLLPRLAILIAMIVAFLPRLKRQYKRIISTQTAMGMYTSNSITDRVLGRFRAISALIGYSLESSIDTADSMNARGYGMKGRTSYSNYRWQGRDTLFFVVILSLVIGIIVLMSAAISVTFYPSFSGVRFGMVDITAYVVVSVAVMLPTALNIWEGMRWHRLISKI